MDIPEYISDQLYTIYASSNNDDLSQAFSGDDLAWSSDSYKDESYIELELSELPGYKVSFPVRIIVTHSCHYQTYT